MAIFFKFTNLCNLVTFQLNLKNTIYFNNAVLITIFDILQRRTPNTPRHDLTCLHNIPDIGVVVCLVNLVKSNTPPLRSQLYNSLNFLTALSKI